MSTDKVYGRTVIQCDMNCESYIEADSFDEAVAEKKEQGWKNRRVNGEWLDLCPDCAEAL